MTATKDHVGKTLRKCLKALKQYHLLSVGGGWSEEVELEKLIKEVKETIIYRRKK